jgi:ATP-binding cassette, subfamily C (CFTR/MRP), member 1
MNLGYARTLQATDLWKLDERRSAAHLSATLDAAWARRVRAADEYNKRLAAGEIQPGLWLRTKWMLAPGGAGRAERERIWREKDGRKRASLPWAMNEVFGFEFWAAGLIKVFGDTSQLMAPLVVRTIIRYGTTHAPHDHSDIGKGVAMAIGLFLLTLSSSVCQHQVRSYSRFDFLFLIDTDKKPPHHSSSGAQ